MENQFTEIMSKKSDRELLEMVTKLKDSFQPEAINAAKVEIETRDISEEKIKELEKEIEEKERIDLENQNEPLETVQRILFFVFFWGFIPWAIAGTFKNKGYTRKSRDAWRFMKYGLFTYIVLFILLLLSAI